MLTTILVIYVTMVYGPIAGWLIEMFPTRIRYSGQVFRCLQTVIEVGPARSPERGTRAALMRFERLTNVRDWKLRADLIETERVDQSAECRSAAQGFRGRGFDPVSGASRPWRDAS